MKPTMITISALALLSTLGACSKQDEASNNVVGMANGMDLTPHSEYVHPKKLMKLANLPALPGALQSATPLRGP